MFNRRVPEAVIRRLPKYYAKLVELESQGVIRISSLQLSQQMRLNASQIRQDLNYFGGFGQQGYGYMIENLRENIGNILGLYNGRHMVVVGCGNIGIALARYGDFLKKGFAIKRIFDKDTELIGKRINGIPVEDVKELERYLKENDVEIGVITVPAKYAQNICNTLIKNGVKAIWNFAPCDLKADNVVVEDVRLADSLFALNYKMINEIYD